MNADSTNLTELFLADCQLSDVGKQVAAIWAVET